MTDQLTNRDDDAEATTETVDLARRAAFKKYASLVAGGAVVAMTPAEVLAKNSYKKACNNGNGNGGEGCSPGKGHGANDDENGAWDKKKDKKEAQKKAEKDKREAQKKKQQAQKKHING